MRRSRRLALVVLALPSALAAQQPAPPPSTGEPWRIIPLPQSSLVYARDGSLIGEIGKAWRTSVRIRTLPRYVGQAFVAVEDQRFYEHDGVDLIGLAGAVKGKITGAARGGASTITQQLVGNLHPDQIDRRDLSLERKVREQLAAREMEKHYAKEQILEAYLNTIAFGRGWYGIEAASRHYFGKPAARLVLHEAASLAALPKSPVGYDPGRNPTRNRERRDLILGLMAQQGMITAAQAAEARRQPVTTAPNAGMSAPAQYFIDAVRREAERLGLPLASGGYRVHTTLDPLLQRAATDALVQGIARVEARPGYRHPKPDAAGKTPEGVLQGAVVAIDPSTGDVRALVGGRNYATAPFNRAILGMRQPGSSFKPFVYAKAIEQGLAANAIVPDTALAVEMPDGRVYRPDNSDHAFMGNIPLREALIHSRNPVAVQLALNVGLDSLGAVAQRAGLSTPIRPFPSSAIGASAVRPVDFVAAYTAFANDGMAVEPRFLVRVDDATGRPVFARPPAPARRALDARVAWIVRDMMRDAAERGTGVAARRAVPARIPIAGKTGTTNDNVDVWFMGMTPTLVAGVWLGFDRPTTIAPGAAGGGLAAPVWGQMIARYYAGRETSAGQWTIPGGLAMAELDRQTGALADAFTPPERRYWEYFLPGTEPEPLRDNPWSVPRWGSVFLP
ncbi:MAG: transglycosylase domain-containing protein [Gemmatimonadaceae bacterium]